MENSNSTFKIQKVLKNCCNRSIQHYLEQLPKLNRNFQKEQAGKSKLLSQPSARQQNFLTMVVMSGSQIKV
jgi:hypothetical protein